MNNKHFYNIKKISPNFANLAVPNGTALMNKFTPDGMMMQVPHARASPSVLVLAAHEVGEKLGWIYPGQNLQTVGTDLKFDCQTKINKNAVSDQHVKM